MEARIDHLPDQFEINESDWKQLRHLKEIPLLQRHVVKFEFDNIRALNLVFSKLYFLGIWSNR